MSALFLDLDRLKAINDYLGHQAGDRFIRVFADRLRDETTESDLTSARRRRVRGDSRRPAVRRRRRNSPSGCSPHFASAVAIDGELLTRTVSIGVAFGQPGADAASDLLRRADQAVLNAKNAGGNTVAVFTGEMSLKSEFRNDIELHLQNVVDSGALFLHYLPEVDMRTGRILATEALVRWGTPPADCCCPTLHQRRRIRQPLQANWVAG